MAPDGNPVNNGKFNYLVRPPGNISPIITHLMSILNVDVLDYQGFLVVGKYFIVFLKDELYEQVEIYQGGASHLIFTYHNGKVLTYLF